MTADRELNPECRNQLSEDRRLRTDGRGQILASGLLISDL